MICKVRRTIADYRMIDADSSVCVALSGGADSMALLYALNSLKSELHFSLCAAHVNHGIRGEEANRDEDFVSEQCRRLNIPLYKAAYDVPAVCKQTGEGLEECGRRLRYAFFQGLDVDLIATAHNLNDRIETFLFRYARGSGGKGLCSIPYVRGNIIRPLLDCSRSEIEAYCEAEGIPFVLDSTNDDMAYSRNRIRHGVIPQLKVLNPAFEEAALRCMETLCDDEDYLNRQAESLLLSAKCENGYHADILREAHTAVSSRSVAAAIYKAIGVAPDYRDIQGVLQLLQISGQYQLSANRVARVRKGILDFPVFGNEKPFSYSVGLGITRCGDYEIEITVVDKQCLENTQIVNTKYNIFLIDYDKISGNLSVRNRREGDTICLAGRNCTKSLKKLLNEAGILPEKRDSVLLLTDEIGIVLAEGFGVCKRAAVSENTDKILKISFGRK